MRAFLALGLAVALLLSACGDDKAPSAAFVSVEDDVKAAEQAIGFFESFLREEGFQTAEDDEDDTDFEFSSEECRDYTTLFGSDVEEFPGSTADRSSSSLERGEVDAGSMVETAEASVALVKDQKELEGFFALLKDQRLEPCLREGLDSAFAESVAEEGGGISVADLKVDVSDVTGIGEEGVAITMSANLQAREVSVPIGFRLQFGRQGRAIAFVALGAVNAQAPRVQAGPLLESLLRDLT